LINFLIFIPPILAPAKYLSVDAGVETKVDIVSSLPTVLPHCPLSPMLAVALLCRRRYADLWIVGKRSSH
jgi:hypothetical protein